jgi:hypothetical protein
MEVQASPAYPSFNPSFPYPNFTFTKEKYHVDNHYNLIHLVVARRFRGQHQPEITKNRRLDSYPARDRDHSCHCEPALTRIPVHLKSGWPQRQVLSTFRCSQPACVLLG